MPTRNVLAVTDRLDTFAVQKGDPAMMEIRKPDDRREKQSNACGCVSAAPCVTALELHRRYKKCEKRAAEGFSLSFRRVKKKS